MQTRNKPIVSIVLIIYLFFLIWLLFFYQDQNYSRLSDESLGIPNLEPLKSISHFLFVIFQTHHGFPVKSGAAVNLLGNVLIFVPVGYLMSLALHLHSIIKFIVVAVLCITTIEFLQWVFKIGIFDIDDIILNTLGVMTGYYMAKHIH